MPNWIDAAKCGGDTTSLEYTMPQVQNSASTPPALSFDTKDTTAAAGSHRKIVWALLHHLAAAGFRLRGVVIDTDQIPCADFTAAMEHAFSHPEAQIEVQKEGFGRRSVTLDGGAGSEIIADWSSIPGDRDGFDAVMGEFDSKAFA